MAHVGVTARSLVCKRSFSERGNHVTFKLVVTHNSHSVSGHCSLAQTGFQHVPSTELQGTSDATKEAEHNQWNQLVELRANLAMGLVLEDSWPCRATSHCTPARPVDKAEERDC